LEFQRRHATAILRIGADAFLEPATVYGVGDTIAAIGIAAIGIAAVCVAGVDIAIIRRGAA
jgi:hypothetical protein